MRIDLEDGKYTYFEVGHGKQEVYRYGYHWRDVTGDKFIAAMADRIEALEAELAAVNRSLEHKADEWQKVLQQARIDGVNMALFRVRDYLTPGTNDVITVIINDLKDLRDSVR